MSVLYYLIRLPNEIDRPGQILKVPYIMDKKLEGIRSEVVGEKEKRWRCPRCYFEISEAEYEGARVKAKCTHCWLEKVRNFEEVKA